MSIQTKLVRVSVCFPSKNNYIFTKKYLWIFVKVSYYVCVCMCFIFLLLWATDLLTSSFERRTPFSWVSPGKRPKNRKCPRRPPRAAATTMTTTVINRPVCYKFIIVLYFQDPDSCAYKHIKNNPPQPSSVRVCVRVFFGNKIPVSVYLFGKSVG